MANGIDIGTHLPPFWFQAASPSQYIPCGQNVKHRKLEFDFEGVESIYLCDSVSWEIYDDLEEAWIHPKEFFMTSPERFERALENIELELKDSIEGFRTIGLDVEAQRIEQRTKYDLEMLKAVNELSSSLF